MLNDEQRAVLESLSRTSSPYENYILRSILTVSAAPAEGRETSAPTCNIAVDLTRELVRSAWVKRFNYVYDRMADEDSELMGFARAIQLECFKTIATAPTMSEAARDVLAERRRQIGQEGWTAAHDDEHVAFEMAFAAASYAMSSARHPHALKYEVPGNWPWSPEWWRPTTPRRDLVKAGSLILAEIERIDRAAAKGESDAG